MKKTLLLCLFLAASLAVFAGCGQEDRMNVPSDEENVPQQQTTKMDLSTIPGFYGQVLADLYQVDAGLNEDIELVAFDFSQCNNLTDKEKEDLMVYLSNQWQLPYKKGTLEELKTAGDITVKDGFVSFDKGILISLKSSASSEEKKEFSFSAQKYRSSLGAYLFSDCKATFDGKQWNYTIGNEMIS